MFYVFLHVLYIAIKHCFEILPCVIAVAVFAVIICAVSAVSSVSGIKHTNDEDSNA